MAQFGEFSIIDRYFTQSSFGAWASKGVGDDCAIIDAGLTRLAVTTDMTTVGVHFPVSTPADAIGYKALAVNLSDLAAAGATPRAFFLSIALPDRDDAWLKSFTAGLMELSRASNCPLLGGDTTRTALVGEKRAPASISITAIGELPSRMGLTRSGAEVGDDIWVSGTLGAAWAALAHLTGRLTLPAADYPAALKRLERPEARNALGTALLSAASACADISDGLAQDLGHILEKSGVAADLSFEALPADASIASLTKENRLEAILAGGDDYELVFTAPKEKRGLIEQASISALTPVTRIGRIRAKDDNQPHLIVKDATGAVLQLRATGFDHFA